MPIEAKLVFSVLLLLVAVPAATLALIVFSSARATGRHPLRYYPPPPRSLG